MDEFTGTVQYVNPQNQWGQYSFRLQGDQRYFNTENDPAPFKGKILSFNGDVKGARTVIVDESSINVLGNAPAVNRPKAGQFTPRKGAARAQSNFAGKDDYWAAREKRDVETQKRIELQSCRNSALTLVTLMLQHSALDLGKTANKKAGVIEAAVNHYTQKYLKQNNFNGTPVEVAEPVEQEAAVEPAQDETGEWS